jgi:hypothetical protein
LHIANNAFLFCFNLSVLTFKAQTRPIIGSNAFGRTKVNVKGIDTGIPGNMFVPDQDGKRYYAKKGGALAKNETITKWLKKYTFDENGVLIK